MHSKPYNSVQVPKKNFFYSGNCMFLNTNIFSNLNCSDLLGMKNLQEQVKKHYVTKNCYDLSLFEQIFPVTSNFLQILSLQH